MLLHNQEKVDAEGTEGREIIKSSDEDLRPGEPLLAIRLRQIDLLSRAKDDALPGPYVGRYGPQAQRHVEGIDAQRRPEGELADPMLFRMAAGAQRNGVAIGRLHSDPAVASRTHMRGLRWRCFAAGDTRKLTDKGQVLHMPVQVWLGLATRYGLGDARARHCSQELSARWCSAQAKVDRPSWATSGTSRKMAGAIL
jgi:hypothetical protein